MVLQTANIVGGFLLSASTLKTFGAKEYIEKGEGFFAPFRSIIGVAILVLGVIGLIQRLGLIYINIPFFGLGASYPQALPAIAMGLLLASHLFEKFPGLHSLIEKMRPYEGWLGIYAILTGLVSIFYGCVLCVF